jgi:hypothetical protein
MRTKNIRVLLVSSRAPPSFAIKIQRVADFGAIFLKHERRFSKTRMKLKIEDEDFRAKYQRVLATLLTIPI